MEDILRFVNSEYKEKISLADIAQKYFYNPSYFSRLIKNYFGQEFQRTSCATGASNAPRSCS